MRLLNSLVLTLVLLAGTPLALALAQEQSPTQAPSVEAPSEPTDAEIRERKNILLLFPLGAAVLAVIAVAATRGKRRRRLEQAQQRDNDNA